MTKMHLVCHSGLVVLAAVALVGTARAQEVAFPDLKSSYLKTGDFGGPDHAWRVRPGHNKDQVRLELGNPHFSEGISGVNEWDYAFNFYTGKGSEHVTCQLKVKFDKVDGHYRVGSTHWNNSDCAALVQASGGSAFAVPKQ